MRLFVTTLVAGLTLAQLGCRPEQTAATTTDPAASAEAETPKVVRIVFVDKEGACACTRERVDKSWAELQAALGQDSKLPVERVYIDTQHDKAAPYLEQAQVMVIPGVYLLAEGDKLVELLQGEVTQDQLLQKL